MALVDYISFDDIRAALGVSKDEIDDATLSLDVYAFNHVSELEHVSPLILGVYAAQLLVTPTLWTPIQTRFFQSFTLFSAYAVAKQATISLPLFSPKEQTDGKASMVRYAQDPYKATITRVLQQYDAFKAKLIEVFNALQNTSAPVVISRPYLSVGSPIYNPVTGS